MKYYFVEVDGVMANMHGPFKSGDQRNQAAKVVRNQDDDTICFWLNITNGEPHIGEYSGGFMEGDDNVT